MTNKSDAKEDYIKFIEWTELLGFKIEKLNSDSGGEYTSSNGKLTVNHNAKVITAFEKITVCQSGCHTRLNITVCQSG